MAADAVTTAINNVKVKAGIQKFFGWSIALVNGLFACVGATQIHEVLDVVLVTFFAGITALGVVLIVRGNKKTKLIETFFDYAPRLAADPERSIDLLAASCGVTVAVATKHISDMLAFGFFPNCFLDTQHNKLVTPAVPQRTTPPQAHVPHQAAKRIVVHCRGCGAPNTLVAGTVGECEYCGSQISE